MILQYLQQFSEIKKYMCIVSLGVNGGMLHCPDPAIFGDDPSHRQTSLLLFTQCSSRCSYVGWTSKYPKCGKADY